MGLVYFAPELNLLGKYALNNSLSGSELFSPRIRSLAASEYELLLDNTDTSKIDRENLIF